MFNEKQTERLEWSLNGKTLQIIPWGHGLRVCDSFSKENNCWALTEKVNIQKNFHVQYNGNSASIVNGQTKAEVDQDGKITFYSSNGQVLLEEFWRFRKKGIKKMDESTFIDENMLNNFVSALKISGREFKPVLGGDYQVHVRFEANDDEKIFGMGQYQQKQLNLKGCQLELAHRNSQASVPFMLSNKGYGFLWNNPSIGKVTFAENITDWYASDTTSVDYWICADETPKKILEDYTEVTGRAPKMPDYGLGLWQSKLRYRTQSEVLKVAHRYHDNGIPLSVIVVDYFHWPNQGDFKFDEKYWPDPQKMVNELDKMGIKLMVSIWPNIDKQSENYQEMLDKGYLVKSDRGSGLTMLFQGNTTFFDTTNPKAREFVWDKVKKNYYDKGVHIFWLDEAEPEYSPYDFDNYRLKAGRNTQVGNVYPKLYSKGFYEGMQNSGQEDIVNLVRSAWAGSQKYGALVWTGDIDSSFRSFKYQYQCGLNMGIAGIPWWTTDIGGFHGGNPDDDEFRELIIRWFEFGTFCPVLRMHGDREPHTVPVSDHGGGKVETGAGNEIWSYGQKAFEIMKEYVKQRNMMKPYISDAMNEAHDKGYPVMRPLFFDFPNDKEAWNITDQHMFGDKLLVAPIFDYGLRKRLVYLPVLADGKKWININNGDSYVGGKKYLVEAPLNVIPVFKME